MDGGQSALDVRRTIYISESRYFGTSIDAFDAISNTNRGSRERGPARWLPRKTLKIRVVSYRPPPNQHDLLSRGTPSIQDPSYTHKNQYISVFLLIIIGSDYHNPPEHFVQV